MSTNIYYLRCHTVTLTYHCRILSKDTAFFFINLVGLVALLVNHKDNGPLMNVMIIASGVVSISVIVTYQTAHRFYQALKHQSVFYAGCVFFVCCLCCTDIALGLLKGDIVGIPPIDGGWLSMFIYVAYLAFGVPLVLSF